MRFNLLGVLFICLILLCIAAIIDNKIAAHQVIVKYYESTTTYHGGLEYCYRVISRWYEPLEIERRECENKSD